MRMRNQDRVFWCPDDDPILDLFCCHSWTPVTFCLKKLSRWKCWAFHMLDEIKAAVPDFSSIARLGFKNKFLESKDLDLSKAQCPLCQVCLPQFQAGGGTTESTCMVGPAFGAT